MPTQKELDQCYMQVALLHSNLSKAKRKKVGSCLITSTGAIVPAYNGTPKGTSNTCEKSIYNRYIKDYELVTLPEVIHAERNVLIKCAKEGISTEGATLYVTLSCCKPCAAMIIQAGIKEVVYLEEYRDLEGLLYLQESGIIARKITLEK